VTHRSWVRVSPGPLWSRPNNLEQVIYTRECSGQLSLLSLRGHKQTKEQNVMQLLVTQRLWDRVSPGPLSSRPNNLEQVIYTRGAQANSAFHPYEATNKQRNKTLRSYVYYLSKGCPTFRRLSRNYLSYSSSFAIQSNGVIL